jgi:ABC-2 type transport system permease protein
VSSAAISHTAAMTRRHIKALSRQPWMIAMTLVQPIIWLLLFGALFERVVDLPAFASESYVVFLMPGIAIMTAVFSGGWVGVGVIADIEHGVLDRFLVAPTNRSAVNIGRLVQQGAITLVQTVIIVALGYVLGAHYPDWELGTLVLIAASVLLATAVGSLSITLGLVSRREESLIITTQLLLLPLTFVSTIYMQLELMPSWMQTAARFNPVDWAVIAAREGLTANPDWELVAGRLGLLAVLTVACIALATWAFRSYQRSL